MNTRWSPFTKQLMVIGSLALIVWFLVRVSILLPSTIVALLLAYIISFPVGRLVRRTGWPRLAAVGLCYVVVLVLLVVGPVLLVPRIVALVTGLATTLRHVLVSLTEATPKPIALTPNLTIDLGPFYTPLSQWLITTLQPDLASTPTWQGLLFPFAGRAVSVVRGALTSLISTIYILVVSFYVAKDAPAMGRFVASRVPESLQPELDRLWRELTLIWDAYLRGQIILGLLMAIITWLVTTLLGVHNAPALGMLAFVVEFVPGVGHVVAAIIAILIGLAMGSTWLPMPHLWFALAVGIAYFLMSQFENMYLLPRVIGRQIALHPVVVIIGALAGAHIGGVLGILLAAPVIASLRVLFGYGIHKLLDEDPFPPPAAASPEHDLYWRGRLREHPVAALLFDLDGTLAATDERAIGQLTRRLATLRRFVPLFDPEHVARRVLVALDAPVNDLIILLCRLRLKGLQVRLSGWLHRVRGYHTAADLAPVAGSVAELHALAQDYPLALITNRGAGEAAAFVARYNLAALFPVVIARDDAGVLKPQVTAVRLAARRLGVPVADCVMVADTPADLRAAQAAGALAVGVLSGVASAGQLAAADLVIPSVAELCRWLPPGDGRRG